MTAWSRFLRLGEIKWSCCNTDHIMVGRIRLRDHFEMDPFPDVSSVMFPDVLQSSSHSCGAGPDDRGLHAGPASAAGSQKPRYLQQPPPGKQVLPHVCTSVQNSRFCCHCHCAIINSTSNAASDGKRDATFCSVTEASQPNSNLGEKR